MNNKNISKNRYEAIYEEMLKKKKQSAINALNSARKEAFDNVTEAAAQNTVPKDNVIKKQTPDFSFTMPKNITKQQSANTGKVLYLAPWDEKQSDESLYNVMKGMNSELGGLFDKTLGEYEAEQRNFKEKVKRLTDDYNKKMAQIMRTNTADKAQNTAVKYSGKAYGEVADRPNLYAANTKNYTAPQAPSASFKQAENTKDSLRLQYANSGRNYVPQSKNIQGNYAQNNENNSTNLLNFAYAGDMIKNRKTNDTKQEKVKNYIEKNIDKKSLFQLIFGDTDQNSILEIYPKNSPVPSISNTNTETHNREETEYWDKRKKLSEEEKNYSFLRRAEPNINDYEEYEDFIKVASAYREGRDKLLEENKKRTTLIEDAVNKWNEIQEESDFAKRVELMINYRKWLTENGMEDYVPGKPYLYPIEINPAAVTSGLGDGGNVEAGQKVDFGFTTYEDISVFKYDNLNRRLLHSKKSYIDENGLVRMQLKPGVEDSKNDYYFVAISKGLAQTLCNKFGEGKDLKYLNSFAIGSTLQFTFGDVNGRVYKINVVVGDVKATEGVDMYPHTNMIELVVESSTMKKSKISTGKNVDLDKWFNGDDVQLIAIDYIINNNQEP